MMYKKPRIAGCNWQHRGVTLTPKGELAYCAVESKAVGSALSQNAEQLYMQNKDYLADIVRTKCDNCMHDYSGIPPADILLQSYKQSAVRKIRNYFTNA